MPVQVNLQPQWEKDSKRILAAMGQNPAPHVWWRQVFLKEDGAPYRSGDIFRWEEYAQTLEELAATNCESYYRGALMEKIVAFSRETGVTSARRTSGIPPRVGGAHLYGL